MLISDYYHLTLLLKFTWLSTYFSLNFHRIFFYSIVNDINFKITLKCTGMYLSCIILLRKQKLKNEEIILKTAKTHNLHLFYKYIITVKKKKERFTSRINKLHICATSGHSKLYLRVTVLREFASQFQNN